MDHDEFLRQQTQEQQRNNPSMDKKTEAEVPNWQDRQTINNEIDKGRAQPDQSRR